MPVIDTDIVVYGSAVMSDDDVTTNIGGAIDLTKRVIFTDVSPSDTITVFSSSTGDTTQTVTIYGRDVAGVLVSEGLLLTGTTPVTGVQTFERILKIVSSAVAVGSVTVEETTGGQDLVVIEPGVTEIRRPFYNAVAEAAGGADKTYYEKIFFKNTNTVSALTAAVISETADPLSKITFMLPATLDDTGDNGVNNRQVAPAGTFDSANKNVANGQVHSPTTAQGVWVALTLTNGDAAAKSSFTLRESGETA
jgi:hypothetical protein